MSHVHPLGVQPLPRNFVVRVEHAIGRGPEDATMWVAQCDDLHLATEARTYDALIERVRAVVPDIIALNRMGIDPAAVRLRFEYEAPALEDKRMAL
jgi:hypothetical protein